MPVAAAPEPGLAPDIARILERGRLIVAIPDGTSPPFLERSEDRLGGTDVALAREIAQTFGVALALDRRAGGIDGVIQRVMRREADLGMGGIAIDLERAKRVRFSRPYAVIEAALLANRARLAQADAPDPLAALNRADVTIALRADRPEAALRSLLPEAAIRRYANWVPEMVDAVSRGEVAAALGDEVEIGQALRAARDAPLRLRALTVPALRQSLAAVLPWDSVQLASWLDLFLERMGAPLSLDQLVHRYEGGHD
ncbi:MAG TPA: transporter substrate-binding domain-containing protein [Stellaceae bacterium]|nr:transporter substrate-binding domain-containing protein [Stellaceae bacterium]